MRNICASFEQTRRTQEEGASVLNPFKHITQGFIVTFGITPPSPEQELKATVFICAMLLGVLVVVGGMGLLVLRLVF
jgi:hypothetical protein